MIERTCVECGTKFPQTARRPMKFCGHVCRSRKHKREAYHRDKIDKFSPTKRSCSVCGTAFLAKKRNEKYCCSGCYKKGWHFHNKKQNTEKQKARRARLPEWYEKNDPVYAARRRQKMFSSAPWEYSMYGAKSRAKKKGIPFDLTDEWARARWTPKCEVSGIEFTFGGEKRHGPLPTSITIDRIVPSLGYVQSNCRFVLHAVNAMKSDGDDDLMFRIALGIVKSKRRLSEE